MKKLITVVGLGNTGRTIVSLLLQEKQHIFTINILDPSEEIEGSFLDLSHASMLTHHKLILNDFELFEDSDFVFHTAGAKIKQDADRNSVVHESLELTSQIFDSKQFTNQPYIIVISNPVDVICTYMYNDLKITAKQIIGTGTLLDTARLQHYIRQVNDSRKAKGLVLGEHGENMVCFIDDTFSNADKEKLKEKTLKSAKQIKKTQGATYYGVAQSSVKILEVILKNDFTSVLPLSIYNNSPVFSSVESKFNGKVIGSIENKYSNQIEKELQNSINSIKKVYSESK